MKPQGQFITNEIMKEYVNFICSHISLNTGASLHHSSGFSMKGYYIPVELEILNKLSRSAEIKLTAFSHSKEFIFYMSRHKSPEDLFSQLQEKINELTLEIITENELDRDKIFQEHNIFTQFKNLPK